MGLLTALCVLSAASIGQFGGGDPSKDMLLVGDKAYGMIMPVQVCCPSIVSRAIWSSDGKCVLFVRDDLRSSAADFKKLLTGGSPPVQPPQIDKVISIWNRATQRNVEVWRGSNRASVDQAEWIPASNVALAIVSETLPVEADPSGRRFQSRLSLIEIDSKSGVSRILKSLLDDPDGLNFDASPKLPVALIYQMGRPENADSAGYVLSLQVYRPGSALPSPLKLPQGVMVVGWLEDGKSVALVHRVRSDDGKRNPPEYSAIDIQTGRVFPIDKGQINFGGRQVESTGALELFPNFSSFDPRYMSVRQNMQPVWLIAAGSQTEQPEPQNQRMKTPPKRPDGPLVAAETEYASLCPTMDGVLYITRGIALYRPIMEVPKELYLKAKAAAEKAVLMSQAKQMALGLIMYGADNDDILPGNGADWQSKVAPYLKNDSLFNGFNYTFPGGSMTAVERPAETELGFIQADGGRVVAYCDGHVKWVPDK